MGAEVEPRPQLDLALGGAVQLAVEPEERAGLYVHGEGADVIVAARLGSPLVVGVGQGEHFVASDASPLVGQRVVIEGVVVGDESGAGVRVTGVS